MDIEKTLAQLELRYSKPISWYMFSPFYADSDGNVCETGVLLFCENTSFHCYSDTVDSSFSAIDVLTIDHAKRTNVLDFVHGKDKKLKCMGSLPAMFTDSLDVIELDNKKMIFLKIKGTEFKQMLKIAASKQKYSMEEFHRTKQSS